MDPALQSLLTILGGFLAGSGGFWIYLRRRHEQRDFVEKLIMGLAHDKIVYLGIKYIEKGFVNKDEYDDLIRYFWEPYMALGGDGSAERIINLVKLLPLKPEHRQFKDTRAVVDALPPGADSVIEKINQGDDTFERNI